MLCQLILAYWTCMGLCTSSHTTLYLQIKHLQQIKALCPGALEWEHILTTNATTKRQEQQLLIKLPSDSRKSKQTFDTANMQLTFFRRLQQHAQEYQVIQLMH